MKTYDVLNPIKVPGRREPVTAGTVNLGDAAAARLLASGSIRPHAETVAPCGEPSQPVAETAVAEPMPTAEADTDTADAKAAESASSAPASKVTPIKSGRGKK